ncbi:MAG: hypothetical protein GY696_03095 [Gammaproteobacteria bacterium]|nr:hypothetical protein [Gammaproteobacteria bacterium]
MRKGILFQGENIGRDNSPGNAVAWRGGARRLGLRPKPWGGFPTRMLLGAASAGAPPQTPLGALAPRPPPERGLERSISSRRT